jgi:hypothetical protein
LCALSDQCLVCLYTPCLLWRCFFFRLRVSWLPGVDVSRQYFCALRRF